jgi:uncharacterized protein YacL
MVCYLSCSIAAGLIVASIVMLFMPQMNQKQFLQSLDPLQKDYYYQVVKNRLNVYLLGTLIGLVVATLLLVFMWKGKDLLQKVCYFIVTVFLSQIIIYTFAPKKYMLDKLNNQVQVQAWLKVYKSMMVWYWGSFILGLVGYGLVVYGLNKCK